MNLGQSIDFSYQDNAVHPSSKMRKGAKSNSSKAQSGKGGKSRHLGLIDVLSLPVSVAPQLNVAIISLCILFCVVSFSTVVSHHFDSRRNNDQSRGKPTSGGVDVITNSESNALLPGAESSSGTAVSSGSRSHVIKSMEQLSEGNREEALKEIDLAIEMSPRYADAYYDRGIIRNSLGNTIGALNDYTEAITLNPRYWQAYNNRALIYARKSNLEDALSDMKEALEVVQNFGPASKVVELEVSLSKMENYLQASQNVSLLKEQLDRAKEKIEQESDGADH